MSLVIDSSATLAWVYSEETTEAIAEVLARMIERGAWVPALWRLEVANVLQMNVRRGRHDAAFRDAALADLAVLPINIDAETDRQAWGVTLRLAERHKLTRSTRRTSSWRNAAGCLWELSWTKSCAMRLPPKA